MYFHRKPRELTVLSLALYCIRLRMSFEASVKIPLRSIVDSYGSLRRSIQFSGCPFDTHTPEARAARSEVHFLLVPT